MFSVLLVWYCIFPQRSSFRRLHGIHVLWSVYYCFSLLVCLAIWESQIPSHCCQWLLGRQRLQDFPWRKELRVFAGRGAGRLWQDRKQVTHSSYILVRTLYTKLANFSWHPLDSLIPHIAGPLLGSTLGTAICQRRARPRCDDCTAAWWNGRSLQNRILGRPLKLGMGQKVVE